MSFADEEHGLGRPGLFTRAQHLEALAWFRAQNGRRGALKELAARHGIASPCMAQMLRRAEKLESSMAESA